MRDCYYKKKQGKYNLSNGKISTARSSSCVNSTIFIQNYSKKNLCPLYSNNHDVDYQHFFEFYNS